MTRRWATRVECRFQTRHHATGSDHCGNTRRPTAPPALLPLWGRPSHAQALRVTRLRGPSDRAARSCAGSWVAWHGCPWHTEGSLNGPGEGRTCPLSFPSTTRVGKGTATLAVLSLRRSSRGRSGGPPRHLSGWAKAGSTEAGRRARAEKGGSRVQGHLARLQMQRQGPETGRGQERGSTPALSPPISLSTARSVLPGALPTRL